MLVEAEIIDMLNMVKIQVSLEWFKNLLFRSFKFVLESLDFHFVALLYELLSLNVGHIFLDSCKILFVLLFGLEVAIVHKEVDLLSSLNETI